MDNIAYHFTGNVLRDGSPIPPVGQTLVFPGEIEICVRGYHWSKHPFDALKYAPGPLLHKVRYGGETQEESDKGCSSERTIIASFDATLLLRRFAADKALSVSHLWGMPEVVSDYLHTLDETKRVAAESAAQPAAWSAAWSAENSAAHSAHSATLSWSAAWSAAWSAVREEFLNRVTEKFREREFGGCLV